LAHCVLKAYIEGIADQGMANADFVDGLNVTDEMGQIIEVEVVPSIDTQSRI
jgi:hypothetical protein